MAGKKEKATHITPTVGRVVWFTPQASDPLSKSCADQPCAAHVAHVHEDGTLNLMVISAEGNPEARHRVTLVQDGEDEPDESYCAWMPFQKGQAAKAADEDK